MLHMTTLSSLQWLFAAGEHLRLHHFALQAYSLPTT